MAGNRKKYITKEAALQKIQRYCAYQDRCHQEVRFKLLDWGVYGDTLEEIMADLVIERFLDEERFARSYARGKFRMKRWGRQRILQELKRRRISAYCIRKAMTEIEEEDYQQVLREVLQKKWQQYVNDEPYKRKQKTAKYAQSRGFELSLIWDVLRALEAEGMLD